MIDYLGVRRERNSILEYCTVYAAVHKNLSQTKFWIDTEKNNYVNMHDHDATPGRSDRLDMNAMSKQNIALEGSVDCFLESALEFF